MALNLKDVFEKHHETMFREFEWLPEKYKISNSYDICAFTLLDKLAPSEEDIVSAAEHDIVFLSTPMDVLAEKATEEDILALVICGVAYSEEYDCLMMWK